MAELWLNLAQIHSIMNLCGIRAEYAALEMLRGTGGDPMTIEEMRARKIELGLTSEMIAEASGVPLGTVQKIFSGATKAPRKFTIDALTRVLQNVVRETPDKPYDKSCSRSGKTTGYGGMLRDVSGSYSAALQDPRYTIDDYYALPDERRVELIDGAFYDMSAPSVTHQWILGELYMLFRNCAKEHGMPCTVLIAPCDVRLDRDNYTMVQPDVLVICGTLDRRAIRIEGAPDLAVELLSPSTRRKDMLLKLAKYENAGVREYWIVDPEHRLVTVHYFEEEDYLPHLYSFDSEIPVYISDGACKIDFSEIGSQFPDQPV